MLIQQGRKKSSEDAFDAGVREWYASEFEQAKAERAKREALLNKDAYKQKDKKTPVGRLVAEIDMVEYLWCQKQYGQDCWKDPDFIRKYKKYREQGFLSDFSNSSLA